MSKEHCPHCSPSKSYKDAFAKAGDNAMIANGFKPQAECVANQVEKRSATMMSLDELYHVAQTLESQAHRLRGYFGLVIASQPPASTSGQLAAEPVPDCELVGRLEEISRCLQRTVVIHEETIELRRV